MWFTIIIKKFGIYMLVDNNFHDTYTNMLPGNVSCKINVISQTIKVNLIHPITGVFCNKDVYLEL